MYKNNQPFFLHICVAHYLKIIIGDIKRVTMNMELRTKIKFKMIIIQSMCTIMKINNYDTIKKIIKQLLILLLSRYTTIDVESAKNELASLCKQMTDVKQEIDEINEGLEDDTIDEESDKSEIPDQIYKRSKFYKDAELIHMTVCEQLQIPLGLPFEIEIHNQKQACETVTTLNDLFCPEMVKNILTKYYPYICLWSGLLLQNSSNSIEHLSNATVEGWFNEVENVILQGVLNIRPNRFVQVVHGMVTSKLKEVMMDIPRENCARGKFNKKNKHDMKNLLKIKIKIETETKNKKQKKQTEDDVLTKNKNDKRIEISSDEGIDFIEETWMKKPKRTRTYFDLKYLENLNVQFTPTQISSIKNLKLENGLIKDPSYYVETGRNDYLVCAHKIDERRTNNLKMSTMQILHGNKLWFDSEIINGISIMFLKKYKNKYSVILDDSIGYQSIWKKEKMDPDRFMLKYYSVDYRTKKIFVPVNVRGNHWVLAYGNLEKKEFAYLDPQVTNGETKYLEEFKQLINVIAGKNCPTLCEGWKTTCYDYPTQVDGYSCGVFIMYFIEQLLLGDAIDFNFNHHEYRRILFRELLEISENMTNICGGCIEELPNFIPRLVVSPQNLRDNVL